MLRRYSRQPHLWATAQLLAKVQVSELEPRPHRPPESRIHRVGMRLGPEVLAQLAVDYQFGMSTTDLQATYGLAKGSVRGVLREAGMEMRRRPLDEKTLARVEQRYLAGATIREVAAELGLPKTTVQDALARMGVQTRAAARRKRR